MPLKVLFDIQTLYTPDKDRGLGAAVQRWMSVLTGITDQVKLFLIYYTNCKWVVLQESSQDCKEFSSIEEVIFEYDIDIYHVTNPLMPNIRLPKLPVPCALAVTVHDLIPLRMPEVYLHRWEPEQTADYQERIRFLKHATLLLSNSESTNRDLHAHLTETQSRTQVVYIPLADEQPRLSVGCPGDAHTPFVFAVVGEDRRKNTEGMIRAFAQLDSSDLDLVVAGIRSRAYRECIEKLAQDHHVSEHVKVMPFISNDDLDRMFQSCAFVCFPSHYEGFGIPALEAIQRQKWVVAYNNSSIPEVAGPAGIYATELTDEALASAMRLALHRVQQGEEPEVHQHVAKFSHSMVRGQLLQAYHACMQPRCDSLPDTARRKVTIFSPMPPKISGIADYNTMLTPYLGNFFRINISERSNKESTSSIRIYHMGNNMIHEDIFEAMDESPGITVLHDVNLWGFFTHTFYYRDRLKEFRRFLREEVRGSSVRADILQRLERKKEIINPPLMIKPVLRRSRFIIVHSRYAYQMGRFGAGEANIVPLAGKVPPQGPKTYDSTRLEVVVPGGVWQNKRHHVVIQAFYKAWCAMPGVHLRIVGGGDKRYIKALRHQVESLGMTESVTFEGYVDNKRYEECIANAAVVVCLRWPTMGETSGAVVDALRFGRPTIVTEVGSYMEYPDGVVWKVPISKLEEDLLASYIIEILNNPNVSTQMAQRGYRLMQERHDPAKVAWRIYEIVRQLP